MFWRRVVGRQQVDTHKQPWHCSVDNSSSSSRLAAQLHELAWGSLLQQQPAAMPRALWDQAGMSNSATPAAAAVAAPRSHLLQVKLQQYMQAHVQWRQQQLGAEPLLPAEKWPTLEHEEKVRSPNTHSSCGCCTLPVPILLLLHTSWQRAQGSDRGWFDGTAEPSTARQGWVIARVHRHQ
jgi:hypothetical protein